MKRPQHFGRYAVIFALAGPPMVLLPWVLILVIILDLNLTDVLKVLLQLLVSSYIILGMPALLTGMIAACLNDGKTPASHLLSGMAGMVLVTFLTVILGLITNTQGIYLFIIILSTFVAWSLLSLLTERTLNRVDHAMQSTQS